MSHIKWNYWGANQRLNFKIELNSRLFAFLPLNCHIELLYFSVAQNLLFISILFFLFSMFECNSPSHTYLLLISCSWFMNVILHMEFSTRSFLQCERDKCELLNANCQPGWWLLQCALYISKELCDADFNIFYTNYAKLN